LSYQVNGLLAKAVKVLRILILVQKLNCHKSRLSTTWKIIHLNQNSRMEEMIKKRNKNRRIDIFLLLRIINKNDSALKRLRRVKWRKKAEK
jgi:hypothetical protein